MDYPRFDPQSALTPLQPKELQALDALLQRLPADGAMSLDGADGFLSALVVGPAELLATLPTADWLPWVWGGDAENAATDSPAPFGSKRQRKDTVVLLLRHLRHLRHQFEQASDDWEPIFSIAEQGAQEWADERDWCTGFLQAVDLQPHAWGGVFGNPELHELLLPLLVLGGGLEGVDFGEPVPNLEDAEACDKLSRAVPDAVLALHAWFHPGPDEQDELT